MRNRVKMDQAEDDFVNRASSQTATTKTATKSPDDKTRPVTMSLTGKNLTSIDNYIREAAVSGQIGVTRTDIVKAALMALEQLPPETALALIAKLKS